MGVMYCLWAQGNRESVADSFNFLIPLRKIKTADFRFFPPLQILIFIGSETREFSAKIEQKQKKR